MMEGEENEQSWQDVEAENVDIESWSEEARASLVKRVTTAQERVLIDAARAAGVSDKRLAEVYSKVQKGGGNVLELAMKLGKEGDLSKAQQVKLKEDAKLVDYDTPLEEVKDILKKRGI